METNLIDKVRVNMSKMYCPKCDSDDMFEMKEKRGGRSRFACRSCKHRTMNPNDRKNGEWFLKPIPKAKRKKRYVVTSAQNDTPIEEDFFTALKNYCNHNDADLIIIPVRYKNPDSFHNNITEHMQWPIEIEEYLYDADIPLNENIKVMGDIKVVATAVNPLSGLDTISGTASCIIGHPQLAMKMVPTPIKQLPKIIHTTGSISKKNYSRTKQGVKGKHHHTLSALVVEVEENKFWIRQLIMDDNKGFQDLDKYYTKNSVEDSSVDAIVYGDIHTRFLSDKIKDITFFNEDSITNTLNPKYKIFHDIHDHSSGSHHTTNDHIHKMFQQVNGYNCVRSELNESVDFIDSVGGGYIVSSNHHDHLYKWLNNYRKEDILNADIYYELMDLCRNQINNGKKPNPFELYMQKYCESEIIFIDKNDEFIINGIDCSQHGDRGANGGRPSPRAFSNAGHKMFIAHSHTPTIEKGLWQVGTSTLDLEYASGLSSWLICHGIIYPSGKCSLINIVGEKWRM